LRVDLKWIQFDLLALHLGEVEIGRGRGETKDEK